jgi:hypothetical protein
MLRLETLMQRMFTGIVVFIFYQLRNAMQYLYDVVDANF